jgi:hypothetical protein
MRASDSSGRQTAKAKEEPRSIHNWALVRRSCWFEVFGLKSLV